ncbi:MAG: hypothetical protein A2Y41_03845 [Spirochaetes bacterium GWB1_36_13]|nr:MAG: hypothetical protein A2Y41_03845 [Spirochaetes bacterium GWB1_36_13]
MNFVYNFKDILDTIKTINNIDISCQKSTKSPDEYYSFKLQKVYSSPIMVCYNKNDIEIPQGFIYPESLEQIFKFLKKTDNLSIYEQIQNFKINLSLFPPIT